MWNGTFLITREPTLSDILLPARAVAVVAVVGFPKL